MLNKLKGAIDVLRQAPCTLRKAQEECSSMHDPELIQDRLIGATHEAGHGLLYLLGEFPIERMEVSQLSNKTRKKIRALFGPLSMLFTHSSVTPDTSITLTAPDVFESELTLAELAGVASEQAQPVNKEGVEHFLRSLDKIKSTTWTDVLYPYETIHRHYTEIAGLEPSHEQVVVIITELLNKLTSLFKQPKFEKAITVLRDYLLEKKALKGKNLNQQLKEMLHEQGIGEDDLREMQREVLSLDIDRIIHEYLETRS